ncbi:Putative aliphatic sulfonates transport permease protein ssuC [Achromobacter xylosoxidans]|nr:Putative aliphatic sulfonates transport permease protein ssuC [Achromobacter xylosoxidans]
MDAINANRASAAPAGGASHAAVASAAALPAAGSPGKTARAGMPAAAPASRPPRTWTAARLLPLIGPLALYVVWDLVVRLQLVSPVLLPTPGATLVALAKGMAGGPLLGDFLASVSRTLQAFVIAGVIGVPLGVLLGSNEKAYRSVEFLVDFFRSTPSSALIPLFLMIFGVTDMNKIAIAAFAAVLVILFNSAYGVINARKQRVMAARVMGASRWQIFKDVLIWESLQPTFVGLRSGVSMALVIVIVAEMFIGSDSGLGNRIINAQQVLNVRDMYASILAAGALGYVLNILFLVLEKRVVHWSGR